MNKRIKIVISIIMLIVMLGNQLCYANIAISSENSFMEVNKTEISPSETLEITIDLSKIEYDKFKILLNSNINTEEIYVEDDTNIIVDNDSNAISVEIDKTKMNVSELTLYYVIPENIEIGSIIQLLAQVVANVEVITDNITDKEMDEEENTVIEEQVVLEEMKEITIIEKSEDLEDNNDNENNENGESNDNGEEIGNSSEFPSQDNDSENQPSLENTQENNFEMQNDASQSTNFAEIQSSTVSNMNSNMNFTAISYSENSIPSSEAETVTYNGSSNNYLSSLQIEGVELNTTFNKENRNYFVEIQNQTSLNVTAVAEDENAKVVITGEDSITSSESKILISVTAENGNIRYYRIFVTVAEEEKNET